MFTVTVLTMLAIAADNPPFKFTTKKDDDRVTATVEKDRTVIDITSPRGISEVTIERNGDAWPETVVLRLRLRGFEQFDAKSDKVSLKAGMLSHSGNPLSLSVNDKKESPLDPKSAYFMDFKMVGKDGKPTTTIPLPDGYFEMRLPKPFFEGNPKSVTLYWIDFFRR